MDITLEFLVDLAGDLEDGGRASEKLRSTLRDRASRGDVESLMYEAIEGTESYHNKALQDIVNNIGERLGFDVEYGRYRGTPGEIGYDGYWVSDNPSGHRAHIVVETKKATAFKIDPEEQPGGYMEELSSDADIDRESVFGLIAIGEDDARSVVQTVRGSRFRDQIRIISCGRLLELLEIKEDSDLSHGQVAQLLLPMDTIDVGNLVDLVTDVVRSSVGAGPDEPELVDGPSRADDEGIWDRLEEAHGIKEVDGEIVLNDELTGAENMVAFIAFLFDEEYLSEDDLPYSTGGPKRYLLNTSPEHRDGSEMVNPKKVREGIWLETHSATRRKKDHMIQLVEDVTR